VNGTLALEEPTDVPATGATASTSAATPSAATAVKSGLIPPPPFPAKVFAFGASGLPQREEA
jgi:hypothetical protein